MTMFNLTQISASDLAFIRGLKKRDPNLVLSLLGTQLTAQQLVDLLQGRIDANQATIDAHAAWIKAADDAKALREKTAPTLVAFKQYLLSRYANDSAALADYGLPAPRKAQKPVKVKAAAADKAVATRKRVKAAKAAAEAAQPAAPPAQPAASPAQATGPSAQPAAVSAQPAATPAQPAPKGPPTA